MYFTADLHFTVMIRLFIFTALYVPIKYFVGKLNSGLNYDRVADSDNNNFHLLLISVFVL